MYIGDSSKKRNKIYREHTDQVLEDRKNTDQGMQIDEQENTGQYTYSNIGDEICWAYWASGETTNPNSPPEMTNREIHPGEYMKKSEFSQAAEARKFGSWGQNIPACSRPEGLFPIRSQDGNIDNQYEGKELINEESQNHKKIKNINGVHVPYGHPGIVSQCANQDEHQQFFIPSGGILEVSHKKSGFSTKIFDVDDEGWIDAENPASLDGTLRIGEQNDGAKVAGINLSKANQDTTGHGAFVYNDGNKNIVCYSDSIKEGPFIPGALSDPTADKHRIGVAPNGDITQPLHISSNAYFYKDY